MKKEDIRILIVVSVSIPILLLVGVNVVLLVQYIYSLSHSRILAYLDFGVIMTIVACLEGKILKRVLEN